MGRVAPQVHDHPPVVIISLADAHERRRALAARLGGLGVPFRFHDAVDGRRLADVDLTDRGISLGPSARGSKPMSRGEIACVLSHYAVLDALLRSGDRWWLVLEDDAVLPDDLPTILRDIDALEDPWDVIKLGALREVRARNAGCLAGGRALVRPFKLTWGAHAYAVTRAGAARILEHGRVIEDAFDGVLDRYWMTGAGVLMLKPWAVFQSTEFASQIDGMAPDGRWTNSVPQWAKAVLGVKRRLVYLGWAPRDWRAARRRPGGPVTPPSGTESAG